MIDKKRGLGRGLDQLITRANWLKNGDLDLYYCPIEHLSPNPYQPRQVMNQAQIEELAESIRLKGVIQPILVTRDDEPDRYRIIAGERRWRAAALAGLAEVPVIIREAAPAEAVELALIENIQRLDLSCIEEAIAFKRLQEEFELSQEEIARRVGKSRPAVANTLRLLNLPASIQQEVLDGHLTMGHARALLALGDEARQIRICNRVIAKELSVRETERIISEAMAEKAPKPAPEPRDEQLRHSLEARLGTRVSLRRKGERGNLTIAFESPEQLERLCALLGIDTSQDERR